MSQTSPGTFLIIAAITQVIPKIGEISKDSPMGGTKPASRWRWGTDLTAPPKDTVAGPSQPPRNARTDAPTDGADDALLAHAERLPGRGTLGPLDSGRSLPRFGSREHWTAKPATPKPTPYHLAHDDHDRLD